MARVSVLPAAVDFIEAFMATCDELKAQRQQLLTQLQALNSQLTAAQNQAVADAQTAVLDDTFPGTLPSTPFTVDGIQARITYLGTLMVGQTQAIQAAILFVIGRWQAVINDINNEAAIQDQINGTNAALSQVNQQIFDQNCQ